MATQSAAAPTAMDEKPQNGGTELVQPTNEYEQTAREEPAKPSETTSSFVNSEPMREDQVENAVKFLSHPKVRGSPIMYRRSFLEKKGLTKEEIDEAFRRVPDSPPIVQTATMNQDGQLKTSSNIRQPVQTLQPASPPPKGAATSLGTLSRYRFHWSHAILAVGLLAASGAGTVVLIKNSILPWLKSWIRKVVMEEEDAPVMKTDLKPTLAEETAAAAKAAAAAAVVVAKASQDLFSSINEETRYFKEFKNLLDIQVQETKSITNAIRRLEGKSSSTGRTLLSEQEDYRVTPTSSKQPIANGKVDYDLRSVKSSSSPASVEPSTAPPPKSYMEIMAMVQRGEKPSNIRDINDLPPNPNQQPSNPRLAPRTKPWEIGQTQNSSVQVLQPQVNGEGLNSKVQETTYQFDDDTSVPWWQRKNARTAQIDNEIEFNAAPYGARSSEQPVQRSWVPPQAPPVQMPEAAEAIRRPKPLVQKEQFPNDQSVAQPSDESDELQRITKLSESGGAIDATVVSSTVNSSEIQEIQEDKYVGN
ncbi:peroxisomal membrane protein PEX14 [Quillaja saponaria]|uniref:Peroxisomal membrane protein PEX14 n=1 Tax=Quillaja saponaria TaxID=32244 RepID=A0AAD7KUA6_QUISA|nr:peroxisomal membrane protein PEX14 [Quillaja saponaria]